MPNKIPFNYPIKVTHSQDYISEAVNAISNDGKFKSKCQQWFNSELECEQALLTPSCTAALEMAAMLINVKPGDEIIMPSYTFVSTANAFALKEQK